MNIRWIVAIAAVLGLAVSSHAEPAVALHGGNVVEIADTLPDPTDLWVTHEDLTRVSGFEVKPEGACLGSICIPLKEGDSRLNVERDGKQWINASELARIVNQPVVAHPEERVWSFGEVPGATSYVESAKAPDFELKDRQGNTVRLSDFRGKKVLLHTWASW